MLAEGRVARMLGEDVQGPLHVLGERGRQDLLQLLEGGGEVRVVLVGVADHQTGRQDDGHRLGQGQLEGRQELLADDAPQRRPPTRPATPISSSMAAQVAVDGPRRHVDPPRDLGRADAVGVAAQHGDDADQPGQPVALAGVSLGSSSNVMGTGG